MAGNKSFMDRILPFLDDDNFMKDDTNKSCPGEEDPDADIFLKCVAKLFDLEDGLIMRENFTSPTTVLFRSFINELCCQITCEALHVNDPQKIIGKLLEKLSSFSWKVKAVLTLSAFSTYFIENRHVIQSEESDKDVGLAALLRGPRHGKLDIAVLMDLIKVIVQFTQSIVVFENYSKTLGASTPSIDLGRAFYQIIVAVLGCSVSFSGMIGASNEFLNLDLSPFLRRVTEIHESFKNHVTQFKQKYDELVIYKKWLLESPFDIVNFLTLLLCTGGSQTIYVSDKEQLKVEELKNKKVMLLISNLTSWDNEDKITFNSIYAGGLKPKGYEIIWVPVAKVENNAQFRKMRAAMPWYSCNSIVSKAAADFIKKEWKFKQEQMQVVVFNEHGKLVNTDATAMIRLWKSEALPFSPDRCRELWKDYSNKWLRLVVDNNVFPDVEESYNSGKLIFFYGSAENSKIVGEIEECLNKIKGYVSFIFKSFDVSTKRKQFCSRLENCISSKMQVSTEIFDSLTQEQLSVHTRYKEKSGFAIITEGASVRFNISLESLVEVLSQYDKWMKKGTNQKDFYNLFGAQYKDIAKPQCLEFKIPGMVGNIPEYNPCPKDGCKLAMETVVTFKCCHGAHS